MSAERDAPTSSDSPGAQPVPSSVHDAPAAEANGNEVSTHPHHISPVPAAFYPPRGPDGSTEWGLGQEVAHGADEQLTAKLAHLHRLKQQGNHFNLALARNRSFHNPHIYAKLVKWADLDETRSNYPAVAHAAHTPPSWDPKRAEVLAEGDIVKLGTCSAHLAKTQKAYVEAREAHASQRTHIAFTGGRHTRAPDAGRDAPPRARPDSRARSHPYRSREA